MSECMYSVFVHHFRSTVLSTTVVWIPNAVSWVAVKSLIKIAEACSGVVIWCQAPACADFRRVQQQGMASWVMTTGPDSSKPSSQGLSYGGTSFLMRVSWNLDRFGCLAFCWPHIGWRVQCAEREASKPVEQRSRISFFWIRAFATGQSDAWL